MSDGQVAIEEDTKGPQLLSPWVALAPMVPNEAQRNHF